MSRLTTTNPPTMQTSLQEEIEANGGRAILVKGDVSRSDDVSKVIKDTRDVLGRIDILVNNAGIHYARDIFEHTEEMWDETLDTNLKGAYLCSKAVAPIMLNQKRGKIINISSNSGMYHPSAMRFAEYVASKAGMNGLDESARTPLWTVYQCECHLSRSD